MLLFLCFDSLTYGLAFKSGGGGIQLRCAQAIGSLCLRKERWEEITQNSPHTGSEIYAGCSNGELIRFALQADDPTKVWSRFTVENNGDETLPAGIIHHHLAPDITRQQTHRRNCAHPKPLSRT